MLEQTHLKTLQAYEDLKDAFTEKDESREAQE